MNLEPGVIGTLLESEVNGEHPNLARLLANAPESFDDERAGKVAAEIKHLRIEGKPVHVAAIIERLKFTDALGFVTGCQKDPMTLGQAEFEAETLWKKYVSRQTAKLLVETPHDLIADPEHGAKHRAHLIAELQRLDMDGTGLAEKLEARLHRPDVKIPRPACTYSINGVTIATAGNIETISGPPKSGKTAIASGLCASTFAASDADCLGCGSSNPNKFAVIKIDTEQSLFDSQEQNKIISRRANRPLPPWFKSYCLTGFTADEIRQAIPLLLQRNKREFGGIHSLILDGGADALHDVNDPGESNDMVAEHHAFAIKFHCPIFIIIHENPGENNRKMRGHYGSQCERKSETNLRVENDEDGICTVWAVKNRHAPILKKSGPRFTWDDERRMHVSIESQQDAKEDAEFIELSNLFKITFAEHPAMSFSDLKVTIKSALRVSEPTAERRIKRAITLGIIKKTFAGLYELKT